jgi:hypothetical protein
MKIRALSSLLTVPLKVVVPVAIVYFGVKLALVPTGDNDLRLMFFLAICLGLTIPIKRVRVDDRSIYVSNYGREAVVPLSQVERIVDIRWLPVRPVTVYFRTDTYFGRHITFIPKYRIVMLWRIHPVAEQLRGLVKRASLGGGRDA